MFSPISCCNFTNIKESCKNSLSMIGNNNTKEQLIIELAKLRNRIYELEDESLIKRKLEEKIAELQAKLVLKKVKDETD